MDDARAAGTADRAQSLAAMGEQGIDQRVVGIARRGMDDEALRRTRESGRATYWSRSRKEYWVKGETSGNIQEVREVRIDCDGDTILLLVDQHGAACHTGSRTCFTPAPDPRS
jgi:phosphoribosyl-AMP cyclohydrolase